MSEFHLSMKAALGASGVALGFFAAVGGILALGIGIRRRDERLLQVGRRSVVVVLVGAVLAVVAMGWALVSHDFSLAYVAKNGSRSTPLIYTVSSLWAALEGSILLWGLVLAGYFTVVAQRFRHRADDPLVAWAILTGARSSELSSSAPRIPWPASPTLASCSRWASRWRPCGSSTRPPGSIRPTRGPRLRRVDRLPRGSPDDPLPRLDTAVARQPDYPDAHFFRGMVLLRGKGDRAAAAEELQAYLDLAPQSPLTEQVRRVLARCKGRPARRADPCGRRDRYGTAGVDHPVVGDRRSSA